MLKNDSDENPPVVEVMVLGDEILWDQDRYEAALELGLKVRLVPCRAENALIELSLAAWHGRQLSAGLRALIVVASCEWAAHGRPGKVTLGATFRPRAWTNAEMANLARVGTTMISRAKEIQQCRMGEAVLSRQLSFGEALRRVQAVRKADLADQVLEGTMKFEEAYRTASWKTEREPQEGERATPSEPVESDHVETLQKNPAELEKERLALRERVQELEAENNCLRVELEETRQALHDQTVLREIAEETIRAVKTRLEEAGLDEIWDRCHRRY